ncbi:wsv200 [White spot syndrome virus]|uniref:Wsv200 n=4 Tax=White spot syndrome virus TaxID=342409 RepID=Q8VB10_WSSVS|nr:wsv200 [Shrimp white spot syndrome virus]AFX59577.1 wsv200 [White spot syndrome virus]AAL33204.1 wsv200 [Shrimp white spot syndrome virus]AAL89123.1 WSSV255 [Shrimp white spot syndrome virus]AWQ60374.1 wsv200 [Shrimp white spot syndrome virus]AWQ60787.1 wsv200 [Shrimp white spot syndrome virus]
MWINIDNDICTNFLSSAEEESISYIVSIGMDDTTSIIVGLNSPSSRRCLSRSSRAPLHSVIICSSVLERWSFS